MCVCGKSMMYIITQKLIKQMEKYKRNKNIKFCINSNSVMFIILLMLLCTKKYTTFMCVRAVNRLTIREDSKQSQMSKINKKSLKEATCIFLCQS